MKLEFCITQQLLLTKFNKKGYSIVADLEHIPFQNSAFDLVWSFGVLQHTHQQKLLSCLSDIDRCLKNNGLIYVQLPNKNGLRNKFGPVKQEEKKRDNMNNWAVRYYTAEEYKQIFQSYFTDFRLYVHSYLGIGVLKEDLHYVSWKNKIPCFVSLALTLLSKMVPAMVNSADSFYIQGSRKSTYADNKSLPAFFSRHHNEPFNNLNIVPLLRCPKFGGQLELSKDHKKLISKEAGIYYPVLNNIPILIPSEGARL